LAANASGFVSFGCEFGISLDWLCGCQGARLAGLSDKLLSMSDLAEMIDEALPKPGKPGPYKKRIAA
jgi:hypothetical protein